LSENVALVSSRLKYPVTSLTAPAVDVTMEYVAVVRQTLTVVSSLIYLCQ